MSWWAAEIFLRVGQASHRGIPLKPVNAVPRRHPNTDSTMRPRGDFTAVKEIISVTLGAYCLYNTIYFALPSHFINFFSDMLYPSP